MKKGPSIPESRGSRLVEIVADGMAVPRGSARLARFCEQVLRETGHAAWKVGILVCGDERITDLNHRYRHRREATDVLSFPEQEGRTGDPVEGDIAISLDALRRNAADFKVPENEEMKRLLVHGLLHIAGMDHGRGSGGAMLALQESLLDGLRAAWIFGEKRK
jgi:probable rRNA maturation factor